MLDCPATCQGLLLQTITHKKLPVRYKNREHLLNAALSMPTPARALNHSIKTVTLLADIDQVLAAVLILC
jgi:hypothetical protein